MIVAKKIKVIGVEPNKEAVIIEDFVESLENLQKYVGGLIEIVYPFDDADAVIICNEEGKFDGSKPNRCLLNENNDISDIIYGSFLIAWAPADREDFCSIPDDKINKYLNMFKYQDIFIKSPDGGYNVITRLG